MLRISLCTRRAPIRHSGQVGAKSSNTRTLPASRLNCSRNSATLLRLVRFMFEAGLSEPITAAAIAARNTTAMISHLQREFLMFIMFRQSLLCHHWSWCPLNGNRQLISTTPYPSTNHATGKLTLSTANLPSMSQFLGAYMIIKTPSKATSPPRMSNLSGAILSTRQPHKSESATNTPP